MFAIMVSIVCNGGKLTCGIRIQGNDLFDASKSFQTAETIYISLICLLTRH